MDSRQLKMTDDRDLGQLPPNNTQRGNEVGLFCYAPRTTWGTCCGSRLKANNDD